MAAILANDIFKFILLNKKDIIPIQFHWNMFPGVQLTITVNSLI